MPTRTGLPLCHEYICRGGSCQEHRGIMFLMAIPVALCLRNSGSQTPDCWLKLDRNTQFVSLNKPHSRLTESGVELRLREMGKKLGVEKVHPHKFRRTMATRAIEKGMPIEQVQKILGHEQIDTTLRYAMVNQNNVKLSHRKFIS